MPYSDYPHGSIAARGEAIYQQQLREKVESKYKGKFLTIDIETGSYEIDADEVASSMRLLKKHPDAVMYCLRIGFPAAHRIGFKVKVGAVSQPHLSFEYREIQFAIKNLTTLNGEI